MNDYQDLFERLINQKLKPNSQGEAVTKCPFHSDQTPSLSINVIKGVWICHAGCGSGNVYKLAEELEKPIKQNYRRRRQRR